VRAGCRHKDGWVEFFFSNSKKWLMWYKVERICMKKVKMFCIVVDFFFYLNSNKKLFMWYKEWKKENILKPIVI
jgi:hypothetical protein